MLLLNSTFFDQILLISQPQIRIFVNIIPPIPQNIAPCVSSVPHSVEFAWNIKRDASMSLLFVYFHHENFHNSKFFFLKFKLQKSQKKTVRSGICSMFLFVY